MCQHEFRNVQYVPVDQRRFQDIRIEFLTTGGLAHPICGQHYAPESDASFSQKLPLVILAEMNHYFHGLSADREGDVQTFGRQEFDSNILESALLHRHVLHVPKLVLAHGFGVEPKRPYTADGAVAQEFRRYQVTL